MNAGEIVGAAVGGVAFTVCVALACFYCYSSSERKRKGSKEKNLEKGGSIVNGRMEVPLGLDAEKEKHVHNPLYRRDSAISLASQSSSPGESPSKHNSVFVEKPQPVVEEVSGFGFEEESVPHVSAIPSSQSLQAQKSEPQEDTIAALPAKAKEDADAGEQRRATFAETGVLDNNDPEREARKRAMQERRLKKKQEEWQQLIDALSVIDQLSLS